jgi:hypothetical protein
MKTTIATAALMILMTAATVNATPDTSWTKLNSDLAFEATVNLQANDIIEFRVAKPSGEKVVLKIYSEKNNKIYQKTLKREKAIELNCDMSDMGNGTYSCVIERNGEEVVRKDITLQ